MWNVLFPGTSWKPKCSCRLNWRSVWRNKNKRVVYLSCENKFKSIFDRHGHLAVYNGGSVDLATLTCYWLFAANLQWIWAGIEVSVWWSQPRGGGVCGRVKTAWLKLLSSDTRLNCRCSKHLKNRNQHQSQQEKCERNRKIIFNYFAITRTRVAMYRLNACKKIPNGIAQKEKVWGLRNERKNCALNQTQNCAASSEKKGTSRGWKIISLSFPYWYLFAKMETYTKSR